MRLLKSLPIVFTLLLTTAVTSYASERVRVYVGNSPRYYYSTPYYYSYPSYPRYYYSSPYYSYTPRYYSRYSSPRYYHRYHRRPRVGVGFSFGF
jgi:hypothetical protein